MINSLNSLKISWYDFDDNLIRTVCEERTPHARVYIPDMMAVVLGNGGNPNLELNVDTCIEDGVPILRRAGGGCAVFIDTGNIIVSVGLPTNGIKDNQGYFDRISQWLIGRLEALGISGLQQEGVSDLVFEDKKVGGSSVHRTQDYLYYSTTLLVEPNIDLMERYLKYPPREPEYRNGRSHSDFVGKLPLNSPGIKPENLLQDLEDSISESQLYKLI